MTDDQLKTMRQKLGGYTFTVESDPEFPDFYSVFADKDGAGAEVAGKIGEESVATFIAETLAQVCR